MLRIVEVDRFNAKSDSGKVYTLITYQDFLPAQSKEDPVGQAAGPKSLLTSTGFRVKIINPQTFEIIATGETLHRI